MRALALALVALLATGCGPQTVQFDHAPAALLYADLKEMYGVIRTDLVRACTGPSAKLDAETCGRLKEAQAQLGEADAIFRSALLNPSKPVDFEKLGVFVRAAMKAGAASQTGGLSGLLLK